MPAFEHPIMDYSVLFNVLEILFVCHLFAILILLLCGKLCYDES